MKKYFAFHLILGMVMACILTPLLLLLIWSFASRWGWPYLLPEAPSLRAVREIFAPYNGAQGVLGSSIVLSLVVAVLATTCGLLTARAVALYRFVGRSLVQFSSILPILVPSTVFAMGIQVVLIHMGLNDTITGVILVHTICALPYTINLLSDMTAAIGNRLEEQAQVLGCPPIRAFFKVTMPSLAPGLTSALSMAYIISYSQYFLTLLIGGGRVKTLSVVMVPFISAGDRALASTYAVLFILSMIPVLYLFDRMMRRLSGQERGKTH